MKELILALLLITYTASQPGALKFTDTAASAAIIRPPGFDKVSASPPTPSVPSADMAMDSSSSDSANVPSQSSSSGSSSMLQSMSPPEVMSKAYVTGSPTNFFDTANNAWSNLQNLGGGCCGNCNKICGFAIKIYGTNNYLTNLGGWYQFKYSTNPNSSQIFTLGQNADCTWSFSNSGSYLSTSSRYSGNWVGPNPAIGPNERWYIERSGPYVYVQSASNQYWYWRASSAPSYFLGFNYGSASRLTLEYYPCDKTFGWNW